MDGGRGQGEDRLVLGVCEKKCEVVRGSELGSRQISCPLTYSPSPFSHLNRTELWEVNSPDALTGFPYQLVVVRID